MEFGNWRLTKIDKKWCENQLCFWTVLSKKLSNATYTEPVLRKLIAYEIQTRHRKDTLDRLHARYTKLRRQREIKEIMIHVGKGG